MSELLIIWATITTATTAVLGVMMTIYFRREHSIEQRQLEAFYEVCRHMWGLTGNNQHPLYAEANLRAVEALNAAFAVFKDTDAEDELKGYRRHPTAENAEFAITAMAEVCGIALTPDDVLPFGPAS